MKIIGGRDYYDGAGYGVDESIIFVRKQVEYRDTPFRLPRPSTLLRSREVTLSFHYVLAAGKVYPAVQEYRQGHFRNNPGRAPQWIDGQGIWHYDLEAALKVNAKPDDSVVRLLGVARTLPDEITRHFRENARADWTDWMITNRVITGLVSREDSGRRERQTVVQANLDDLKAIEFYRVLDAATMHMELSNYIGGVLPHGIDMAEISDTDRIRKAGFDTRRSFRQDPGVKKPRRRKHLDV